MGLSDWDSFNIDGITFMKGSQIKVNISMENDHSVIPAGTTLDVLYYDNDEERFIAVRSNIKIEGWHSCNDEDNIEHGKGWRIFRGSLIPSLGKFEVINPIMEIINPIEFKGINLKNKRCTIVLDNYSEDGSIFVEMEENVGGGSCDGRCKIGHGIKVKRTDLQVSLKKGLFTKK